MVRFEIGRLEAQAPAAPAGRGGLGARRAHAISPPPHRCRALPLALAITSGRAAGLDIQALVCLSCTVGLATLHFLVLTLIRRPRVPEM
jgi:hypothetical protein